MYKTLSKIAKTFFTDAQIYKYGFNWSPMYRRSTGKVIQVSEDLLYVKIKVPISWKNKNYVGSIFGGSLFSATDPIYMIQLLNILKDDYVVWDKEATININAQPKKQFIQNLSLQKMTLKLLKMKFSKKANLISLKHQIL